MCRLELPEAIRVRDFMALLRGEVSVKSSQSSAVFHTLEGFTQATDLNRTPSSGPNFLNHWFW